MSGNAGEFSGFFEIHLHQTRHARLAHGHAAQMLGRLHAGFVVCHVQELHAIAHLLAQFGGDLTVEKLDKLYARLVPSERQKLETNMVLAISGGNVMQRAADAGFPG